MKRSRLFVILLTLVATSLATVAQGQIYFETEPNNNKTEAFSNPPVVLGTGAGQHTIIRGNSTGAFAFPGPASLDQFLVTMPTQALGIYENRLTITTSGPVGHIGSIRGIAQTAAPPDTLPGIPWDGVIGSPDSTPTDIPGQTSSATTTPARYNQWYSFGHATQFYYRVTGTVSTTADYDATWTQTVITPTSIGVFKPGLITMNWNGQGHSWDTDIWVYDGSFNPIPGFGNDDSNAALSGAPITGTSLQSWLARSFSPGTYYLAVSNFNLINNQPSPSDDNFRTDALAEFAGTVWDSSILTAINGSFTITDSVGSDTVFYHKENPYDVNWFTFTVIPEPSASLGWCLLAASVFVRRRRA